MKTSSDYRRIARENLTGNRVQSILVAFVAALLGGLITGSAFLASTLMLRFFRSFPWLFSAMWH